MLAFASVASAASAPAVIRESVSNLSASGATLEAEIDTQGLETSYEFHLLERWRCEDASPPCLPPIRDFLLPAGQLQGSTTADTVSLDLNAAGVTLSPGHDFYEYWVSAANADGAAEGPPERFSTPPGEGGEPPPETEEGVEPLPEGEVVGEPVPEGEAGGEPVPEGGEVGEPLPETEAGVEPFPEESANPLGLAMSGAALQSPAATGLTGPSAAARTQHRKRHHRRHRRRGHRAQR